MSLGFLASKKEFSTDFTTTFSTSSSFTTTFSTSKSTTTTFSTSKTTGRSTTRSTLVSQTGTPINSVSDPNWIRYTGNLSQSKVTWTNGNVANGSPNATQLSGNDGYTYVRGNNHYNGSCCGGINYNYYNVIRRYNSNTSYTTNFTTNFNTTANTTTTFNTSKSTTTTFNTSKTTSRDTSFYA